MILGRGGVTQQCLFSLCWLASQAGALFVAPPPAIGSHLPIFLLSPSKISGACFNYSSLEHVPASEPKIVARVLETECRVSPS